jgi:hypothetical protein
MTKVAGSRSGDGYWGGQIGATALFGFGFVACSVVLLASGTDEPGGAVLLALGGIAFLTTFGWAVDAATRSTAQERALFAWVITQHEAAGHGNDVLAMREAALARDGELDSGRIRALQAIRPDNPYPSELPPSDAPPSDAVLYDAVVSDAVADPPLMRKAAPNRTGMALLALFLALTGLYFSCIPQVFILGWPFQFIASIFAVIAIVPPGHGRRLGITAAIISVTGTVVTLVMVIWRVFNLPA